MIGLATLLALGDLTVYFSPAEPPTPPVRLYMEVPAPNGPPVPFMGTAK